MKRLVITQTSGAYEQVRNLLYPNFQAYASKCKADFIPVEECKTECAVMGKLCVHNYFDSYDRILLLDADLVIRPDCPDLFDMVPEDHFAAYDEGAACRTIPDMYGRLRVITKIAQFYEFAMPCFDGEYFSFYNAGVMLAGKMHENLFEPPPSDKNPLEATVCPEQVYINYKILQYRPKIYRLPVCFNQMPWNWTMDYHDSSFIVHYAGMPMNNRLQLIKQNIEYWNWKFKLVT